MKTNSSLRLNEVILLRCILAILIVFMHSFTCYNHGWPEPICFKEISAYKWLARLTFAFTLEAFVFISGYLFAFQRITLKRSEGLKKLILNKLKRLILPSVIFSILYFALFYEYKGFGDMFYSIINGCGHMWFLPMLFWCFIGGYLLCYIKLSDGWKLFFLAVINLMSVYYLPFRITEAANYMFYFWLGYVFYKHSDSIKQIVNRKNLILGWCIFIIVFIFFRPIRDILNYVDNDPSWYKMAMLAGDKACQLIYASVGLIVFSITIFIYSPNHALKPFTIHLSNCCFGIYLLQQFILWFIYYKTSFPGLVGPYWLPWLGFGTTLFLSYLITTISLKTKVGRFLLC